MHCSLPGSSVYEEVRILRLFQVRILVWVAILTPDSGFPGSSVVKNLLLMQETQKTQFKPWDQEDSLGEGNGNPLHNSCLGNPMDRGAWQAIVHEVAKELDATLQLNNSKELIHIVVEQRLTQYCQAVILQ